MFQPQKRATLFVMLIALVVVSVAATGCARGALAEPMPATGERSVTVLGRGKVSARPDLVQASLGVETFAATVAEATEQNNAKMTAVMAKLKDFGIAEKDIQTANFSINFERRRPEDTSGLYRVSNMVQVKIRDLDAVSSVLDAAIQAGANQVWGVSFTIEDQEALEAEGRVQAMEDARKRAQALADLAGVQLGAVLFVAEGGTTPPVPFGKGAGGGGVGVAEMTSISPGEVQVSYQVQVTYTIEE